MHSFLQIVAGSFDAKQSDSWSPISNRIATKKLHPCNAKAVHFRNNEYNPCKYNSDRQRQLALYIAAHFVKAVGKIIELITFSREQLLCHSICYLRNHIEMNFNLFQL